jgi:hypothetical protein
MDWTVAGQTAAAAVGAAGFAAILLAGRREARGELEEARRLVRLGGWPALAGATSLALLSGGAAPLPLVSASLLVLSGFAAMLAGLSGKPRPTGHFAALLFAAGLLLLALSA